MLKLFIIIFLINCNEIKATAALSSQWTDEHPQNKTLATFIANQSSEQQDIDHLRQQLIQETIIRLSLTRQLYSLVSDVIAMKKEMATMGSKLEKVDHCKISCTRDDDTEAKILAMQKDVQNLTSTCFNARLGEDVVVFNAVVSKTGLFERNTPVNIIYDEVLYDTHNAYSNQTGAFTAPLNGLYVFTWSSLIAAKKILDTELLVNGIRKGLGNCNNEGNSGYENCSNTIPIYLQVGDEVNIRSTTGNYVHGGRWSSFKGWRT